MVAAPSVLVGWQVPVEVLPPALQADKINIKNIMANTRNHFLILPSSTKLTFSTHHSTANLWTGQLGLLIPYRVNTNRIFYNSFIRKKTDLPEMAGL